MLNMSNYNEVKRILAKYGYNEVTLDNIYSVECNMDLEDDVDLDEMDIINNAINELTGRAKRIEEFDEKCDESLNKFANAKSNFLTKLVEDNYRYALNNVPQVTVMDLLINMNINLDVPDEDETKANAWKAANTNYRSGYGANKVGTSRDGLRHRNLRQNFLNKCRMNGIQTVRAMNDDGVIYDMNISDITSNMEWDHILNLAWLTGEPDENKVYNSINPVLYKIFRMHNNDIEASVAYINRPENLIFISKEMNQSMNTDEYGAKHVKYQISSEAKVLSEGAKRTYQQLEGDLLDEIELENMYITLKASMKCALDTLEGVLISSLITSISDSILSITKHVLIQKVNGKNNASEIIQGIIENLLNDDTNRNFIDTLSKLANDIDIMNLLTNLIKNIIGSMAGIITRTIKGAVILPETTINELKMIYKTMRPSNTTDELKDSASSKIILIAECMKAAFRISINKVSIDYNSYRIINAISNTVLKMIVMIIRTDIDMKDRFNNNTDKYKEYLISM